MSNKFKIGDKVRVLDGSNIPDYAFGWYMQQYVGKVGDITDVYSLPDGINAYQLEFHDQKVKYNFDERGLELVENTETITPLPQSEHFLIGKKAAVNLKYIQYISYEVIIDKHVSLGEIFAVTSKCKIILDDDLSPDETIEKFRAYLKEIKLMTTMNYIVTAEVKK